MRNETFKHNGTTYHRITKTLAKKQYIAGKTVIFVPCLVNHYNILDGWHLGMYQNKTDLKARYGFTPHFDGIVQTFELYNCNNEVGRYCKYFIAD